MPRASDSLGQKTWFLPCSRRRKAAGHNPCARGGTRIAHSLQGDVVFAALVTSDRGIFYRGIGHPCHEPRTRLGKNVVFALLAPPKGGGAHQMCPTWRPNSS